MTTTVYSVRVQFDNPKTGFLETKEFDFTDRSTKDIFVRAVDGMVGKDKNQAAVLAQFATDAFDKGEADAAMDALDKAMQRGLD